MEALYKELCKLSHPDKFENSSEKKKLPKKYLQESKIAGMITPSYWN